MEYDVVIVGAGPSGLAAAIRLKQLAAEREHDVSVCVLEKGSEVGAHILSGAVMDPRAITELIPDWQEKGAPLHVPVTQDQFLFLSRTGSLRVPGGLLPACLDNHGSHVVSLGNVCRWLAGQAEALGVEIFPGFAAAEVLYNEEGWVKGVATGDMGVGKNGQPTGHHQPGMELHGHYTFFAEGCRGHLGKQIIERFALDEGRDPQVYGLGIKELWEIPPDKHRPGLVLHTAGWPLDDDTYGGSWVYHFEHNLVSLGLVVGLGYSNPHLSPFEEMQRWKTHPAIRTHIEGGKRVAYGARAIAAGGLQSQPRLTFPGGALIGDEAGFLNAARVKGSHAAIKSGMLAAEAAFEALKAGRAGAELTAYPAAFRSSWLHDELHAARNFKPWMAKGLKLGAVMFGIDQLVFRGKTPWTLHHPCADHQTTLKQTEARPIDYPKPDGVLTFDRLSSVYLSNTNHEENQPSHLRLKDDAVPVTVNLAHYAGLEERYCPAGVYEFVEITDIGASPAGMSARSQEAGGETAQEARQGAGTAGGKVVARVSKRLQINAQNCVHCKTCDIKDPTQNVVWVVPEGGGGPNYPNM